VWLCVSGCCVPLLAVPGCCRYFLDNVAGWILELDRGSGIPFEGNYSGKEGMVVEGCLHPMPSTLVQCAGRAAAWRLRTAGNQAKSPCQSQLAVLALLCVLEC
jgi:hypothetical protein